MKKYFSFESFKKEQVVHWAVVGLVLLAPVGFMGCGNGGSDGDAHTDAAHHEEEADHAHDHEDPFHDAIVHLDAAKLAVANVKIEKAGPKSIVDETSWTGQVKLNEERTADVVAYFAGVVESVPVPVGSLTSKGAALAVINSFELAEAKSSYIEGVHKHELAQSTYKREAALWQKKINSEQDFLLARHQLEEAEITKQVARQKLLAMSIPESVIDILSKEPEGEIVPFEVRDPFPEGHLTQFDVLAPFDGVLIEKNIAQGSVAQRYDVLFRISDLSLLWVDARVTSEQLRFLDPQASVTIRSQAMGLETEAKVSSVGAALDPETQSTYARIELPNVDGQWKAGAYVEVISHHEAVAPVAVALSAVQYLDSRPAVFVRHAEGWEARAVALGRQDRQFVEILSGVKAGEEYASNNSFILKAELGKGEAEHDH